MARERSSCAVPAGHPTFHAFECHQDDDDDDDDDNDDDDGDGDDDGDEGGAYHSVVAGVEVEGHS